MGQSLNLDVPDEIYQALLLRAQEAGQTPEELVKQWLKLMVRWLAEDPLLELSGVLETAGSVVSRRHDEYIGEALFRELRGNKDILKSWWIAQTGG